MNKKIRSITFPEEYIMQVANEDDTIDRYIGKKVDKVTIYPRFNFIKNKWIYGPEDN